MMGDALDSPIVINDDELLSDAPPILSPASVSYERRNDSHSGSHSNDQSNDRSSSFEIDFPSTQMKFRGRRIGDGAGVKRKAEESLSNNPHSKKARARKEQMTATENAIDRAKNADRQAKQRVRNKLLKDADYISADVAGRKQLLAAAEAKELEKRYVTIIVAIRV